MLGRSSVAGEVRWSAMTTTKAYDALFREGVTEVGCMAHARRKFHALNENHRSEIAAAALALYGTLYCVEREA
jgi:transposase